MVDAKELRIGNIIKCIGAYSSLYFNGQHIYSEILEIRNNIVETTISTHKYRDILPIELQEDILLKCGGKKISPTEISFYEDSSESLLFTVINNNGTFYLKDQNNHIVNIPVKTVHHFQNLYFYLFGKEIKIEL